MPHAAPVTMHLDHLIVPTRDRVASARLLGSLLGVPWAEQAAVGPFSPVFVNEGLTLDFDQWADEVPRQHYCFRVDDDAFEAILGRLRAAGLAFRSHPLGPDDHCVNTSLGGKLLYWSEPDGHAWEILTHSYARQGSEGAGAMPPPQRTRPAVPLRVAPLTVADAPRYRRLMLRAYTVAADAFTSTAEERAAEPEAWWARRIADAKGLGQAFGAFLGDELVGTVAIEFAAKPKTRHKAHLLGMFVDEPARGQGAGRALVQAALDAAAARPGVQVVTLTVTQGNRPAVALYESCGFQTFGVEPMAIATPQGLLAKVHMWRRLLPQVD